MDNENILKSYIDRWDKHDDSPGTGGFSHTRESWNKRADLWVSNFNRPSGELRNHTRMMAIADYLRYKGLLKDSHSVVDIGCGPGYYVAEFAKTSSHVMGIDLSDRMIEYATKHSESLGLKNISFRVANFPTDVDVMKEGWEKKFDLVFTSITPAFSGMEALTKMNSMSRSYCFNNGWVYRRNHLREELMNRIYGKVEKEQCTRGNMLDLFNILWLMDCYPEITYYEENNTDRIPLTEELVTFHVNGITSPSNVDDDLLLRVKKELEELAEDGMIVEKHESIYGFMLWRTPQA